MGAPFAGKSLGGHPTGTAVPAQLVGIAPSRSADPRGDVSVMAGGVDWVDQPPLCQGVIATNGWPCEQPPRKGSLYCFGHRSYEE